MWILYFEGSLPMMCDREAMAPESGSKFKFGFPQLPTKFITLMYSPRTSFGISYFHCVQTYKDTIYILNEKRKYFSQIIGQHWKFFYQSICKLYIYSTKFKYALWLLIDYLRWWDNLTPRTILHLGQFDTDHARRTIWHRGQFDTEDNLTPSCKIGQFDTDHARRTIWHRGQFDTEDNLTPS